MRKWKDETSYSRGTKTRIPRVLYYGLPHDIHLVLHRLIHRDGQWFYTIKWQGLTVVADQELESKSLEDAKEELMLKGVQCLRHWANGMQMAANTLEDVTASC